MQIGEKAVTEFKNMYFREYGIRLSTQKAVECGNQLIRFVKAVYGNDLPKRKDIDSRDKRENNERVLNLPDRFFNGRLRQSERSG